MPDLESFIISSKNQEDFKSDIKRKKSKKRGDEDDDDDEIIVNECSFNKSTGTRNRPAGDSVITPLV